MKAKIDVKVGQTWEIRSRDGRNWAPAEVVEVGQHGAKLRYTQFFQFLECPTDILTGTPNNYRLVKDVE